MLERSFTEVSAGIVTSGGGRRSFGTKQTPLDSSSSKRGKTSAGKRRSISPDGEAVAGVKRSKSVTEELTAGKKEKAFEEPPWE
jgi:hypothetical protein